MMQDLGSYLKKEREKQKLSLEDMASRTKIHIQKLRAIEAGDREVLPAEVFYVGLVKSYARELKLDPEKVDALCKKEFQTLPLSDDDGLEPPPQKSVKKEDPGMDIQPMGRFQVPKVFAMIAGIVVSVILLLVIIQVLNKMKSYSRETALPQEVFQDQTGTTGPSESAEDTNSQASPETEDAGSKTPAPKTPEPKRQKTKPIATSQSSSDKVAVASRPETETNPSQADRDGDDVGNSSDDPDNRAVADNKLTLTALEPVRAEVIWSDGYVQIMLLKSQESKTLVFTQPITIRVNNGGAVQVSYNSGEKKVPGTFNQPIELKYP